MCVYNNGFDKKIHSISLSVSISLGRSLKFEYIFVWHNFSLTQFDEPQAFDELQTFDEPQHFLGSD